MTSAPSHLLRSNGNRLLLCLFLLFLFSCTTQKKVVKPVEPEPTVKDEDKVRVYDPASGKYILVPRGSVKVDTVQWTEEKGKPILSDEIEDIDKPVVKDHYTVSLFVPLNAQNYPDLEIHLDSRLVRFMQYYAGMRLAAEELKDLKVTFQSFDTETSSFEISNLLKDPAVRKSDVIVGPYEKEHVEQVASFGLLNQKVVISPWLPAFNVEPENPYLIQTIPGLSKNADAIMDYIADEHGDHKVFLVARNNPSEIQRLQYFKQNTRVRTEDLIIDDESIELAKTALDFLLEDPDGTVFVMPYYSRSDEQFVSSFLRKLHADKGTKSVIVFGLPQWTGFNSLNPNYMESLSVHISSPTHINTHHTAYRSFRDKFYRTYFVMPDNNAYQGYDLMVWIAESLARNGIQGLTGKNGNPNFGLTSGFDIRPVYKSERPSADDTPLYFENSKVRILKYINQDFEVAR